MSRRKQIKCPLCESTYHYHSETTLCDECDSTFQVGKKIEQRLADGEMTLVTIGYTFTFARQDGDFERPSERHLMQILEQLGGALLVQQDSALRATEHLYRGSYLQNDWPIRIETNKLPALKELLAFAHDATSYAYNKGFNEGRNLLTALASGELTVEQMNAKRAKGVNV